MPKKLQRRWGVWQFKSDTFVLQAKSGYPLYEFDFDRCYTSAGILDQIFQIYTLAGFDNKDIRDLLSGIDAVLMPQANYCSARSKQDR